MMDSLVPLDASTAAPHIDGLLKLFLWVTGGFFVLVVIILIVGILSRRQEASGEGQISERRSGWKIELLWAGVPAAFLLLLGYMSQATASRLRAEREDGNSAEAIHIDVVAKQFFWSIRYAGADGKFGRSDLAGATEVDPFGLDRGDAAASDDVAAHNELFLPLGRPARITLRSRDVIHAFYVPEFRVQQDVLPGSALDLWVTPTTAGQFELACNQYCGALHHTMRATVTVGSESEFRDWLAKRAPRMAAAREAGR